MTAEIRRIVTPQDREAARRLKQLFEQKKYTDGLTQVELARRTGIPQPNLSQYMNGVIALKNADTVFNLANALGVNPAEIDPRFEARYKSVEVKEQNNLPLKSMSSGEPYDVQKRTRVNTEALPTAYGIVVDTATYAPIYQRDDILVADSKALLRIDRTVAVQYNNREPRFYLYRLLNVTNRGIEVTSIPGGREIMEDATVSRRAALEEFFPSESITILLADLKHCHRVRMVDEKN